MIDSFRGEYAFLSNFYPCEVSFEGDLYPSAEHAFKAAKTWNASQRRIIRGAATPGQAKRLGGRRGIVDLRPNWDEDRLQVMAEILWSKFTRNPDLEDLLLATGDEPLVEGNTWGDTYWGVCRGRGQNRLGRLLVAIREQLRGGRGRA